MKNDIKKKYTTYEYPRSRSLLGANYLDGIWYFKVFSENAEQIDLVLFESDDAKHPVRKITLDKNSDGIFSTEVAEDLDGILYGYQVRSGNSVSKILLDPYAREIGQEYLERNGEEFIPALGILRFPSIFDWQGISKPKTPLKETLIYEAHVRGLTALHPQVNPDERGSFQGLASDEIIAHLKRLGVTAIELLPVNYLLDEDFLVSAGLVNYWGYNPINYFSLSPRLATRNSHLPIGDQFKTAVRKLHKAGIEVILDVVFNHTGEGSISNKKFVSLRGLDEKSYYRGTDTDPLDFTGCGNTLNTDHPRVVQLICDSLRYWALDMQVDGFRFDLMSALSRTGTEFNENHPLLVAIAQDPVLSEVKLIAEPWDATAEGYQVGRFPRAYLEWNDQFRDTTRRFWRGDGGTLGELAHVISGSSNVFHHKGSKSVNFVTAHDGFTLRDLVSFSEKKNLANEQNGEDGANNNYSFNSGREGETTDREINSLRLKQQKNLLTTLLLAKGVPMILGGDELNRTQLGNNNAYCHDVDWNYLDWSVTKESNELIDWISDLTALRKRLSIITANNFYSGSEVQWLNSKGVPISIREWRSQLAEPFCMLFQINTNANFVLIAMNPTAEETKINFSKEIATNANFELILTSDKSLRESFSAKSEFRLESKSLAIILIEPSTMFNQLSIKKESPRMSSPYSNKAKSEN